MKLVLTRKYHTEVSVIGSLEVDGHFECYTLEDKVRIGIKIPGKTAIPAGTYGLILDWSNRFHDDPYYKKFPRMPHVLAVPGFEGIRIHAGNTAKDTEGCILVGTDYEQDFIGNSRIAFEKLMGKLVSEDGLITIEIKDL